MLGIKPELFDKIDIHIHVPEGATPKDGPSAGVAHGDLDRLGADQDPGQGDVAMTGEVTLRGRVLPIGGLKEKLLAALRGGLKTVLIPKENEKDLAEIPDNVKAGLEIIAGGHGRRGAADSARARCRNRCRHSRTTWRPRWSTVPPVATPAAVPLN